MQAAVLKNKLAVTQYRGDYWQQSRRPLTSLAFVTPLLAVYEAGVLWLGPQAMRNGADVWMRQILRLAGFHPVLFAAPADRRLACRLALCKPPTVADFCQRAVCEVRRVRTAGDGACSDCAGPGNFTFDGDARAGKLGAARFDR